MTKKKNKRKNSKIKTTIPGPTSKDVDDLCALIDPFCHHAEGVQSPHGANQITIPFTMRGFDTVTTSTGGYAAIIFRCSPSTESYNIGAPLVPTFGASSYTGSLGSFPSFGTELRIVNAGISWHSTIPATAGGGTVAVVPVFDDGQVVGATPTFADLTNTPGTRITDLRKAGSFIFSPKDERYQHFQDTSNTTSPYNDGDWNSVVLLVTGPVSTHVLDIHWVYHFELAIDAGASVALGKTVAPRPFLERAYDYLKAEGGGIFSSTGDNLAKIMRQAAVKALTVASIRGAQTASNYLLPGSGQIVAAGASMLGGSSMAIMDVD